MTTRREFYRQVTDIQRDNIRKLAELLRQPDGDFLRKPLTLKEYVKGMEAGR